MRIAEGPGTDAEGRSLARRILDRWLGREPASTQLIAGTLAPTPRGSKPITSNRSLTSLGRAVATYAARLRPEAPGPPVRQKML